MGFDTNWLLGVQGKIAGGEPWEREVWDFLEQERSTAANRVRRHQAIVKPSAMTSADVDDILLLANTRFLLKGVAAYKGDASPRTYYLQFVARASSSFYRLHWRRRETTETALRPVHDDHQTGALDRESASDDHRRAALQRAIAAAMRQLYLANADLAESLTLSMFDRSTDDEAAAALGISIDLFHQRVRRAKLFLRRLLELEGWRR